MKTPRYFTQTLAAGEYWAIGSYGKYITVLTISASTIELGIDDDPPQQVVAGLHIPVLESYDRVLIHNAGGVAATVVLYIADAPLTMNTDTLVAAMVASLDNIEDSAGPPDNSATIVPAAITTTGVGSDLIFAARATRKRQIFVEGPSTNAGDVYLGFAAGVTLANCARILPPRGTWWPVWAGTLYASSENGTEELHGYELW